MSGFGRPLGADDPVKRHIRSNLRTTDHVDMCMPRMIVGLASAALWLAACGPKPAMGPGTEQALAERPALPDYNLGREGVAIEGYDPVAYFPEGGGAAQAGDPSISTVYEGVTYNFVSVANRDRFLAEPRHYEPAYGGWCAYAMAKGNKINVDPEAYLIQDDRLLLFYRTSLNDTRDKWAEKPADMLIDADINWRNWTGECPHTRLAGETAMSEIAQPATAQPGGGEADPESSKEAAANAADPEPDQDQVPEQGAEE